MKNTPSEDKTVIESLTLLSQLFGAEVSGFQVANDNAGAPFGVSCPADSCDHVIYSLGLYVLSLMLESERRELHSSPMSSRPLVFFSAGVFAQAFVQGLPVDVLVDLASGKTVQQEKSLN